MQLVDKCFNRDKPGLKFFPIISFYILACTGHQIMQQSIVWICFVSFWLPGSVQAYVIETLIISRNPGLHDKFSMLIDCILQALHWVMQMKLKKLPFVCYLEKGSRELDSMDKNHQGRCCRWEGAADKWYYCSHHGHSTLFIPNGDHV